MRNKIFGAIGILWGGAILLNWLTTDSSVGNQVYQSGQSTAAIFGTLMLIAGIYYFFKKTD
ncbi:MAG: hypothetical protein P8Y24_14080 [Gammaproteobacteria bacterium]